MRKLAIFLLILVAASPFAALVAGPVLTGRTDGMLYFFPAFIYAVMIAPCLGIAFFVAPTVVNRDGERRVYRFRQVAAMAILLAGLSLPSWWPEIEKLRNEMENRANLSLLNQVCKAKAEDVNVQTPSEQR